VSPEFFGQRSFQFELVAFAGLNVLLDYGKPFLSLFLVKAFDQE
jgi:hypothetical protein